jgi:hypothetical protein
MNLNDLRTRWMLGVALALALGVLVLAGCGGSSGASGSTTAGSTSESSGAEGDGPVHFEISPEAKACLKEKGLEMPELKTVPSEGPEGGEPPQGGETPGGAPPPGAGVQGGERIESMKKAFEECGVELPEFKGGPAGKGGAPVKSAVFRRQVKEYAACVRKNGYKLAEPNFSGNGPIFEKFESESPAFKRASAKCQGLLGGPVVRTGSEGENET